MTPAGWGHGVLVHYLVTVLSCTYMESLNDVLNQKGFHCAHLNIHSLSNKHDLLRHTVRNCDNKLHVLGLSETWLNLQTPDTFVQIDNYVCIRKDRSWSKPDKHNQIKKGGGVCLYL